MRLFTDIGQLRRTSWIGDHRYTAISSMVVILFIACFYVIPTNGQQKGDEVCETLPSEIHLIKGMGHTRTHTHTFLFEVNANGKHN